MTSTVYAPEERPGYSQDVACTGCEVTFKIGVGHIHGADCPGGETVTSNRRFLIGEREVSHDEWAKERMGNETPVGPPAPGEMGLIWFSDLKCLFCGAPLPRDVFTPTIHRHDCVNPDGWEHLEVAAVHCYVDGVEVTEAEFEQETVRRRAEEEATL